MFYRVVEWDFCSGDNVLNKYFIDFSNFPDFIIYFLYIQ